VGVDLELSVPRAVWSSALSVNEFAACIGAGMEPLGLVQGCSVVSWMDNRSESGEESTRFVEQFNCPHGAASGHRPYGRNAEETTTEEVWREAFSSASTRLLDEATRLHAHGVIGIVEATSQLPEDNAFEFRLSGSAIRIEGAPTPTTPFTTFLAGQKLNRLVEAGFAPVAAVWSFASIGVYLSCVTASQLHVDVPPTQLAPTGEIDQISRAHNAARSLVRENAREQLLGDSLHAAQLRVASRELGDGLRLDVTLRGTRVRRFRDVEAGALPRPVVRLDQ
jgi:hypothetical protein